MTRCTTSSGSSRSRTTAGPSLDDMRGHLPPHVGRVRHRGSCSGRLRRRLRAARGLLAVHRGRRVLHTSDPRGGVFSCVLPSSRGAEGTDGIRHRWSRRRALVGLQYRLGLVDAKKQNKDRTSEVRDKSELGMCGCVVLSLPCHQSVATSLNQ